MYAWKCIECGTLVEIIRPIAECTLPPDAIEKCTCGTPSWQRVFQPPMMMERALPDGTKRKGFDNMKEAAKLRIEASDVPRKDRAGINSEIRRLESIKK